MFARACWGMGLAGALLVGCGDAWVPDVSLQSTPAPEVVSSGDYRFTSLSLGTATEGLDLDGDSTPDNHFPLALDLAYDSLEEAVKAALAGSGVDPDAAWQVIDVALVKSGLPVGTEAYNAGFESGLRSGRFTLLANLAASETSVTGAFVMGQDSPEGVVPTDVALGSLLGSGVPESTLGPGFWVVPYPQSWFSMPVRQTILSLTWDSAQLKDGSAGGGILLSSLVEALLAPIPDSITVGDSTIDVPKELIARNLEASLSTMTTDTGELLCDLTLEDQPALSAYYHFAGQPVRTVNP